MIYNGKTIKSLQLLRGIAVTLVIIAHAIGGLTDYGHSYIASFYHFRHFGAIGMDIFFVISGVIMTVIAANSTITPRQFIIRRCIRILPLYWAASFFYLFIALALSWPIKPAEILQSITVLPLFESGYNAGPVIFLGWTLSFEFLFYLAFTAALLVNRKQPHLLVLGTLLLLVIAGYIFTDITEIHFRFASNPIILEFLLGCICGHLYLSTVKISNLVVYSSIVTGLLLMVYSIINGFGAISMANIREEILGLTRVLKWGIPSFLLVNGLVLLEKNKGMKTPTIFITLGNISYSAYLFHLFCIMPVIAFCRRTGIVAADFFIIVTVVISLFVAYLVYRFAEKPLTIYLNKLAGSNRKSANPLEPKNFAP